MIEGTPGTPFEGEVAIRRRRFASDDSGFAVVWQDDRRFGLQVRVATAEPLPPSGDAALAAYLKRVRHVGAGRAGQLLHRHGDGVLEAIDHDPHGAFRAVGLNPRRTNEAVKSWN